MSALAKHVEESGQAAEFFVNKVLMEHRGTPHAAWARALKDALAALRCARPRGRPRPMPRRHSACVQSGPSGTDVAARAMQPRSCCEELPYSLAVSRPGCAALLRSCDAAELAAVASASWLSPLPHRPPAIGGSTGHERVGSPPSKPCPRHRAPPLLTRPEIHSAYTGKGSNGSHLGEMRADRGFVAKHAPAGPVWNARGVPLAAFQAGAPGPGAGPRLRSAWWAAMEEELRIACQERLLPGAVAGALSSMRCSPACSRNSVLGARVPARAKLHEPLAVAGQAASHA